jgi:uncharacterized RDD family membrane protein YckC
MSDAASTPSTPGWYPDPEAPAERLRYFDGILWTSHRTPLAAPSRPEPAVAPKPAQDWPAQPQAPENAFGHRPSAYDHVGSRAPRSPDGYFLASYGQRVGAWVVDGIIKFFVNLVLGGWALYLSMKPAIDRIMDDARAGRGSSLTTALQPDLKWLSVFAVIQGLIGLGYSAWFLTRPAQATPGKRAMSLHVRRLDGQRLDLATAARRYAIPFLNAVFGGVTYLSSLFLAVWFLDHVMPAWDPRRQALHDRLAGTQVVVTPPR